VKQDADYESDYRHLPQLVVLQALEFPREKAVGGRFWHLDKVLFIVLVSLRRETKALGLVQDSSAAEATKQGGVESRQDQRANHGVNDEGDE